MKTPLVEVKMKAKILRSIILIAIAILCVLSLISCEDEKEIDTTIRKLEIDYDMTYCGISLKDLSALFDEQAPSDPSDPMGIVPSSYLPTYDFDNDGDIDETDYESKFEITVNFGVKKHIDHVYLYYSGEFSYIFLTHFSFLLSFLLII